VVRTDGPIRSGWSVQEIGLEDLVLAYRPAERDGASAPRPWPKLARGVDDLPAWRQHRSQLLFGSVFLGVISAASLLLTGFDCFHVPQLQAGLMPGLGPI
jgi:hypothetical protein